MMLPIGVTLPNLYCVTFFLEIFRLLKWIDQPMTSDTTNFSGPFPEYCDPPRFFDIAFGGDDTDRLRSQLETAGFTEIEIETTPLEARSESAESFATGMIHGLPVSEAMRKRGIP